eukprot:TRINITY_DN9932_c0_g1_i2.p1 TRINITY_DN9932_c0_g1~~TRINITY_DN9932_c0_g1_i2.p1  ORF type:complete len:513 (-),score=83.03 TRINITY_DN9932_c0_g1_i2:591-2129(-)
MGMAPSESGSSMCCPDSSPTKLLEEAGKRRPLSPPSQAPSSPSGYDAESQRGATYLLNRDEACVTHSASGSSLSELLRPSHPDGRHGRDDVKRRPAQSSREQHRHSGIIVTAIPSGGCGATVTGSGSVADAQATHRHSPKSPRLKHAMHVYSSPSTDDHGSRRDPDTEALRSELLANQRALQEEVARFAQWRMTPDEDMTSHQKHAMHRTVELREERHRVEQLTSETGFSWGELHWHRQREYQVSERLAATQQELLAARQEESLLRWSLAKQELMTRELEGHQQHEDQASNRLAETQQALLATRQEESLLRGSLAKQELMTRELQALAYESKKEIGSEVAALVKAKESADEERRQLETAREKHGKTLQDVVFHEQRYLKEAEEVLLQQMEEHLERRWASAYERMREAFKVELKAKQAAMQEEVDDRHRDLSHHLEEARKQLALQGSSLRLRAANYAAACEQDAGDWPDRFSMGPQWTANSSPAGSPEWPTPPTRLEVPKMQLLCQPRRACGR